MFLSALPPRNSLVVLPLALAIPGSLPVLPGINVTQTLVELISELIYFRTVSRLLRSAAVADGLRRYPPAARCPSRSGR